MDKIVQPKITEANNAIEIVVHVTDVLNEDQRSDLVSTLKNTSGITVAEYFPLRYHGMLVNYDRDVFSSQDLRGDVTSQNVHASLIGPV